MLSSPLAATRAILPFGDQALGHTLDCWQITLHVVVAEGRAKDAALRSPEFALSRENTVYPVPDQLAESLGTAQSVRPLAHELENWRDTTNQDIPHAHDVALADSFVATILVEPTLEALAEILHPAQLMCVAEERQRARHAIEALWAVVAAAAVEEEADEECEGAERGV